ncbi:hypothetical protein ACPWSH_26300, partial [Pandoraea pneumonica]
TTFLTPYMIRAAEPSYNFIIEHLPKKWVRRINHIQTETPDENTTGHNQWHELIKKMLTNTVIYGILSAAVIAIMFSLTLPI